MKKRLFDSEVLRSKWFWVFIAAILVSEIVSCVFRYQIASSHYGIFMFVVFQTAIVLFGLFIVGKSSIKRFRKSKKRNKWRVLIITPLVFGLVLVFVSVHFLQINIGFALPIALVIEIPLLMMILNNA